MECVSFIAKNLEEKKHTLGVNHQISLLYMYVIPRDIIYFNVFTHVTVSHVA